jgi:hypothetical protein
MYPANSPAVSENEIIEETINVRSDDVAYAETYSIPDALPLRTADNEVYQFHIIVSESTSK